MACLIAKCLNMMKAVLEFGSKWVLMNLNQRKLITVYILFIKMKYSYTLIEPIAIINISIIKII